MIRFYLFFCTSYAIITQDTAPLPKDLLIIYNL